MFNFFKKRNFDGDSSVLTSPVNGTCIDLSDVPDKVFSERMIGEGVAFIPDSDIFCSPCDGVVTMIARTAHAIGLQCGELEVLLHVGLDTVELNGEGLKVLVKKDQKVRRGMPLIKINRELMNQKSINLVSPLIILNYDKFDLKYENIGCMVRSSESTIIHIRKLD